MGSVAFGCNKGPDDGGLIVNPVVFPWEGALGPGTTDPGSTAAMLIDSNYLNGVDGWEYLNLDTTRIAIEIADGEPNSAPDWGTLAGGDPVFVNLRSVFNLGPTPTSKRHVFQPGFWFTVALFDLPSAEDLNWSTGPGDPEMAILKVYVDGALTGIESRFRITGDNGKPNPLADESIGGQENFQASLEPQRMIRLRGKRGTGKFNPSAEPIGSVEFDLEYSTDCLSGLHPYPSTEASNATAIVGPAVPTVGSLETVRVVMVDPKGFDLVFNTPEYPGTVDVTLAGDGPMLDLAVDDVPGECDLGDPLDIGLTISNVLVTDINGETLVGPGAGGVDTADNPDDNAVFRLYGVNVDDT
jgi:hypothetical protein